MIDLTSPINGKTYYIRLVGSYLTLLLLLLPMAFLSDTLETSPLVTAIVTIYVVLALACIVLYVVYFASLLYKRVNDIDKHRTLLLVLAALTPFYLVLGLIPGKNKSQK